MNDTDFLKNIILMKVGYQTGETLSQIVARKSQEELDTGSIFWGYGGKVCHPLKQIRPFATEIEKAGGRLSLVMIETSSKFDSWRKPALEYSIDNRHIEWQPIPKGISVTGSEFAIVCKNLQRVSELHLDLSIYNVGIGQRRNTPLEDYFKGRTDKACASRNNPSELMRTNTRPPIKIAYIADIIEPYAVMLR